MPLPQSPFKNRSRAFTSVTATTAFSPPILWVQAVSAGSVVMKDEAGTAVTYTMAAGEVISGPFSEFTSTTSASLRLGDGPIPQGSVIVSSVNLAGGAASVTNVLPGGNHQAYLQGGTTATAGFTATVGTMHKINVSGATFGIAMPPITAAIDGQRIAIVNVGLGTTATVISGAGTDSVGNTTGASVTAAGPTTGAVKSYVADNTLKTWLLGI
jgi:hypothetical protein